MAANRSLLPALPGEGWGAEHSLAGNMRFMLPALSDTHRTSRVKWKMSFIMVIELIGISNQRPDTISYRTSHVKMRLIRMFVRRIQDDVPVDMDVYGTVVTL